MARRANAGDALRAQKEAKQKKLLLALTPILLVMILWQGPGVVRAFTGGDAPPEPAPPVASEEVPEAAPDPSSAAAPSTATAPEAAPEATPTGELPDTDRPAPADTGRLVGFDRFVGKDPFRQQVKVPTGDGSGDPPAAPATKSGGRATRGGAPSKPPKPAGDAVVPAGTSPGSTVIQPATPPPGTGGDGGAVEPVPTTALVDVNGTRERLSAGSRFPASDPILRLVSVNRKGVKVALVAGSFSDGGSRLRLRLRKPVTLVSQPDGVRYRITLLRVGVPSE